MGDGAAQHDGDAGSQESGPLVSAVMTAYQHESFVAEGIASVFQQDYRPLELVIVEDGSRDATLRRIEAAVLDAPIAVTVIRQANKGQAAALNAGITATHGDLVALIDGDDLWAPSKVGTMVACAATHPGAGIYQHQVLDSDGKPFRPALPSGDLMATWRKEGFLNTAVHPGRFQVNVPTSGLMFRREVLEAISPIPEALIVCPDFYLFVIALTHGPLRSEPSALATWRSHGANATHDPRFGFNPYWIQTVFPAVNEGLAARGEPVRFGFDRRALWRRPGAFAAAAFRSVQRRLGVRID